MIKRSTEFFISSVFALSFFASISCTSKSVVNDEKAPCDEQTCSNHGHCAVVDGDQAICICDDGYDAVSLECVLSSDDCGDGLVQSPMEECDGVNLNGATCETLALGAGDLSCGVDCRFDTGECETQPVCGDLLVQGTEECDGVNLNGATCETLALGAGDLSCGVDCHFDTDGCENQPVCGDSQVQGTEECDGVNLNGATCISRGYASGTLACDENCIGFDESLCVSMDGCVIDSFSYAPYQVNPDNDCQLCLPLESATNWSSKPDLSTCLLVTTPIDFSYDICAGGICISPGSCGTAECNAPRPNWIIPDTNQRACYDRTSSISCPGTPGMVGCENTPFCGQDAQYGWDIANPATARFARTGTVEPIVVDNVTGLIWQGCSAGQTGSACAGTPSTFTWANALSFCDGLTWDGSSDWGVPDWFELPSIVDYGRSNPPTIDTVVFPNTPESPFWTTTTLKVDSSYGMAVYFNDRGGMAFGDKTASNAVRCVRRPSVCSLTGPRFTRTAQVAGQPIMHDAVTELEWQACRGGQTGFSCETGTAIEAVWQDMLAYCEGLDWGGHSDWSLPNVKELASLINLSDSEFPGTETGVFWSATPSAHPPIDFTLDAYMVSFDNGYVGALTSGRFGYFARCVRRGQ